MLSNASFWTGVAFVLFFAVLAYYGVPRTLMSSLDDRSKRIADELAEARRLREEAQNLLKEYEAKRAAAEREAADIVSSARDDAERLARETQEKMADFVRRRTSAAEAKIAQAEAQAAAEVRAAAVEAAVKASEQVLRGQVSGAAGEELLSRSLGEIRSRMQ
ncbi:MAG TPA: ATP F0F1 synthase subunit B [Beijerinckiaceae bacterium]|jgi:F-type H+-transporting ATPase subunit b